MAEPAVPPTGPRRRPHPLVELTRARLLEFLREPEAVFWVFVFPVLLALALGIAFRNQPVETFRVAVETGSPGAARLLALLREAPELAVAGMDAAQTGAALRTGRVDLVVVPGGDPGDAAPVWTYRYDPTRSEGRNARRAADDALQRALGRRDVAAAGEEKVVQPGARYIDFLIPGLVGLNLMGSGLWGIGFTVVQLRTRKLLKLFAATPMRRSHFLVAFILSRLLMLVGELAALIGFGWLLFGVRVHGSWLDLAVLSLLGSLAFAGIGLLVAARPQTIEGVSGWMNLVMLPMWVFSGALFSYTRFPEAVQPLLRLLPLTALNDALRLIINEGRPLVAGWFELAVLAAYTVVSFLLALRFFRWQ
jgi:ABC-type multidrug transport system permease subunit